MHAKEQFVLHGREMLARHGEQLVDGGVTLCDLSPVLVIGIEFARIVVHVRHATGTPSQVVPAMRQA
jgi:hypothetical protein